ncbi:MAG: hypothetical protein ACRCY5_07020 [Phocaeicola sp.]
MKIELVEIAPLSGNACKIYSVVVDDAEDDLFTSFLKEYRSSHKAEVDNILYRLKSMGNKTGASLNFFKVKESKPTDGIMALYDRPNAKLRLYCIHYGTQTLILGGGGPKTTRTYQEDDNLNDNVELLQEIEKVITDAIKEKDLVLKDNGEITGITIFEL